MKYINKENTTYVENNGDVLTCKYYHTIYPEGVDAIGDCGAEKVDNKEWDIFHVHYETKDAYYGTPMLGVGLINCMILKSDTRAFLPSELVTHNVGIVGSYTSKLRSRYNIEIEPIVNKL